MHYPQRQAFYVMIIVAFFSLSFSASAGNNAPLTVKMGPLIQYESEDGKRFSARYGALSDGSLHFVKVTMPDGKEYTLPQVISGSGVRYTDEREVVWWTHQGTVRVDMRDSEGKWTTKYSELNEIRERK